MSTRNCRRDIGALTTAVLEDYPEWTPVKAFLLHNLQQGANNDLRFAKKSPAIDAYEALFYKHRDKHSIGTVKDAAEQLLAEEQAVIVRSALIDHLKLIESQFV